MTLGFYKIFPVKRWVADRAGKNKQMQRHSHL
jgi:hypothetical protein